MAKDLPERMIERADADRLPADHRLRVLAKALEAVETAHIQGPGPNEATAKSMLGAWARARRVWCEYTGEPLLPGLVRGI